MTHMLEMSTELNRDELTTVLDALTEGRKSLAMAWDSGRDWSTNKMQANLRRRVQAMGLLQEKLCSGLDLPAPDLQYDDDGAEFPLTLPQHRMD